MKVLENNQRTISEFLKTIKKYSPIEGILFTGSYSRADFDGCSDVDLVLFLNGKVDIKEGKQLFQNLLFDLRFSSISLLKSIPWSEDMFYAYLNSRILHDKNKDIALFLKSKKLEWKNLCLKKLKLRLVELSVIYKFEDDWAGLNADSHFFKYLKRGDLVSANRILNRAFELTLDIAYLLEGQTIPDFKNKFRKLDSLSLGKKYKQLFEKSFIFPNLTLKTAKLRYTILENIVNSFKKRLEWLREEDLYNYYLINRGF